MVDDLTLPSRLAGEHSCPRGSVADMKNSHPSARSLRKSLGATVLLLSLGLPAFAQQMPLSSTPANTDSSAMSANDKAMAQYIKAASEELDAYRMKLNTNPPPPHPDAVGIAKDKLAHATASRRSSRSPTPAVFDTAKAQYEAARSDLAEPRPPRPGPRAAGRSPAGSSRGKLVSRRVWPSGVSRSSRGNPPQGIVPEDGLRRPSSATRAGSMTESVDRESGPAASGRNFPPPGSALPRPARARHGRGTDRHGGQPRVPRDPCEAFAASRTTTASRLRTVT